MEKISKNCYRLGLITSLDMLVMLADNHRSVYHERWGVKPASVIIHMPMIVILSSIRQGSFHFVLNTSKIKALKKNDKKR